ncbi:MAG: hypothetical protein Q7R22_012080 [Verrucomicrobiota bacterium JB025]|nr:hypothetical protein [Verrucomicrobiota bacterium JB025]
MRTPALILTTLLAPLVLHAAPEVNLHLAPTECRPGDVVTLTATLSSPELAEFELKLPKNDALHLASREQLPVTYQHGTYTQKSIWLLQPVRSGTITLDGLTATITRAGQSTDLPLPPQTLTVASYPTTTLPETPLPLPQSPAPGTHTLLITTTTLVVVAILTALALRLRRKPETTGEQTITPPTLDQIRQSLATGTLPTADIEHLLQHPDTFPTTLRPTLEQAVYSRSTDPATLLATINKEVHP